MKSFDVIANIQEGVGSLAGKVLAVVTAGEFPSVKKDGKILIFSGNDADKLGQHMNKNVFIQGSLSPWKGTDGQTMFGISLTSFQVVTPLENLNVKGLLGDPTPVFVDVNSNMKGLNAKTEPKTADLLADKED